jgi:Zn-dependent peptidase ImmA (M78 family)/transcriptional regulator with XRE-family HTH domain
MNQTTIRQRLLSLRNSCGQSQEVVSHALGFNDRQTLSDIERGERNVSAEELLRAAEYFAVEPGYFTDPLELAGKARFSWRRGTDDIDGLEDFELTAGRWIAAYKHLSQLRERTVNSMLMQVGLTRKSTFEEAAEAGDVLAHALNLLPVPAQKLPEVLEENLNTLVLFVDPEVGVSGAACQVSEHNTIIINRQESEGRRSFDLAHEFFHLLTWGEMPPCHLESNNGGSPSERKVEKLADNFASGLLMPKEAVFALTQHYPMPKDEEALGPWIKKIASAFHVSGQAAKWRLVNLGLIKLTVARRIDDAELRIIAPTEADLPSRFSARFIEMLGWGIEKGHISVRRAAKLIQTTVDDLADLFAEHALRTPFEL